MLVVKSRKLAFVVKFLLVLFLSFVAVVAGAMLTGGGHGNALPLTMVLGPLNILEVFPFIVASPKWAVYFIFSTVFLFGVYALFVKAVKHALAFFFILVFHFGVGIVSINIFTSFSGSAPLLAGASILNLIVFIPLTLVFYLLYSIHKYR